VAQKDIIVDRPSATNAVDYARDLIDSGYPVLVGVNVASSTGTKNWGEVTDHFLVLHGYETDDDTGKVTAFYGIDNAVSGTVEMTFQVDTATKKISRAADPTMPSAYTQQAYQVDQVRQWRGEAPDSQAGIGALTTRR
jgi:hypothetical protein